MLSLIQQDYRPSQKSVAIFGQIFTLGFNKKCDLVCLLDFYEQFILTAGW